jgi:sec-independent protein translocase protein TatA
MDFFSIWHWLIVGAVLLLVFGGRGRISDVMGDVAKGIKAFKKETAEGDTAATEPTAEAPPHTIDHQVSADAKQRAKSESKV